MSMTKILVVDDDPLVRRYLAIALPARGFNVRLAANGREAVAVVESAAIDLVLTDVFMPEMDGLETILYLRRRHLGLKIIAMSAGSRFTGRSDALSDAAVFGANAVLSKPFSVDEFCTTASSIGLAERGCGR